MMILRILWLVCHNPEIDWRTGKVKMTRCLEECGKQWRPVQGKLGWEKQKEEEAKGKAGKKWDEKEKKKKQKKRKMVEVKRVVEVIKRLEENDLYVKPEKYKWKMREVKFLGMVI